MPRDMQDSPPEQLDRSGIQSRQSQQLQRLSREVVGPNPFWTRKFEAAGVNLKCPPALNDLATLPFLTKQELVDDQLTHPPYGTNLTYPLTQYSRLHQTSGTTGRPMRWLDTPQSWDWICECWQQIFRVVGIRDDDVFAFPFSFGPFIGFWAAFDGAARRGNLCLPMGGMSSEARLQMIVELGATVVCCTPTYALRLALAADEQRIDLASTAVRALIVAGEPGGSIPGTRQQIEARWGARVFDHWGMTDVGSLGIEPDDGPGGLLILETQCIAEIIDSESGQPVAPGALGELVITNLGRHGQPVIRFRTGDLVRQATSPCPSGSQLMRLEGGILGRVDDMLTIRGNNVFPSSVEAILREFDGVAEFRITVSTRRNMPHLKIEVEPTMEVVTGDATMGLVDAVERAIKDRLNFWAEVVPVPIDSLPRFELKGRRFVREDKDIVGTG